MASFKVAFFRCIDSVTGAGGAAGKPEDPAAVAAAAPPPAAAEAIENMEAEAAGFRTPFDGGLWC